MNTSEGLFHRWGSSEEFRFHALKLRRWYAIDILAQVCLLPKARPMGSTLAQPPRHPLWARAPPLAFPGTAWSLRDGLKGLFVPKTPFLSLQVLVDLNVSLEPKNFHS